MKKNRTILWVLLIPILLELLIFFVAAPSRKNSEQNRFGQTEEICDAFAEFECEETTDEESERHVFGLSPAQQFHLNTDLICSKCTFSCLSAIAAPMARGWRMPLRI